MQQKQSHAGKEPEHTALGNLIRERRLEKKLSLRDVAVAAHHHKSYIGRIESGHVRQPSPEVLQRLGEVLDVGAADLFAIAGYRIPNKLPSLMPYLRARYDMDEEQIRAADAFIKSLRHDNTDSGERALRSSRRPKP